MHTAMVIAMGLGLLALCALVGHVVGGASAIATASLVFLPLWVLGTGLNMYLGVRRAGYSVADEAPIALAVFAIPAAAALLTWWRVR